jgi:hypothetical protein
LPHNFSPSAALNHREMRSTIRTLCLLLQSRFLFRKSAAQTLAGCSSTRITTRHTSLPCEQFEGPRDHMILCCTPAWRSSSNSLDRRLFAQETRTSAPSRAPFCELGACFLPHFFPFARLSIRRGD